MINGIAESSEDFDAGNGEELMVPFLQTVTVKVFLGCFSFLIVH